MTHSETFCVKFGDPSFIGFGNIVRKKETDNRRTDKQTKAADNPIYLRRGKYRPTAIYNMNSMLG